MIISVSFAGFSKSVSKESAKEKNDYLKIEKEKNKKNRLGNVTDAQAEYQSEANYKNGKGYLTDFQYVNSILEQEKLLQGQSFEAQGLWVHALGTYYDLMDNNPTIESVETYNSFQKLADAIKSGKPGYGNYSGTELKNAWKKFQLEYEQYWLEESCVQIAKHTKIAKDNDHSYSLLFSVEIAEKYKTLNESVRNGFQTPWKESGSDINSKWLQYEYDDYVCQYQDFEKIILPENYKFEFILADEKGKNIFGTRKFSAKGNEIFKINGIEKKNVSAVEKASVQVTKWGYEGRYVDFISIDLKKIKNAKDNPVPKVGAEIEKYRNAASGYGKILDCEVLSQRENNKSIGLGEITDAEVKKQKIKNSSQGFGSVTDFQLAEEKNRNKKSGYGELSNFQAETQRKVNKRAGFGEITDKQLDIQNKIFDYLVMKNIPDRNYQMLCTEVTQRIYEAVMEENPSEYVNEDFPVENVSWYDIIYFCNRLSEIYALTPVYSVNGSTATVDWNYVPHTGSVLEGVVVENIKAAGFRLPTQGEWDYAANGGKKFYYSGSDSFDEVAWNTYDQHPVAQKMPNDYGMYDMSGNVNEWWWTASGDFRCYSDYSVNNRHKVPPESRFPTVGFRILKLIEN